MPIFNGTAGNDSLTGGAGNDTLNGLAGNDTLNGGAGADSMVGGVGNDVYIVDNLGDVVVEVFGSGIDTVRTSVLDALATYSIAAFANVENLAYTGTVAAQLKGNSLNNLIQANSAATTADTLYGAAGNDTLQSYGGNDSLIGGTGDDSLDGGVGADMMVGGTGNDTFVIDNGGDRAFEYLNGGFDTIRSTTFKDLRAGWTNQVEGLTYTGTTAAVLHGNALGNAITSTSATNDTLNGYDGNDTLDGGGGTDSMVGGLGNDLFMVSTTDVVKELAGEGIDGIAGAQTSIAVAAYATTIENLFYTGATGAALTGNAMANIVAGGSGADTVNGGDGNDSLAGGAGADSLLGGNGDDDLYGGALFQFLYIPAVLPDTAADTLVGGTGNDIYWIDAANDVVTEVAGGGTRDVVETSIDNTLTKYANVEAMVLRSGTEAWYGRGGAGNDILVGNEGDNYLVGGAGNDTMSGNVSLTSFFSPASDVLDGGDGADVLVAFGFASIFSIFQEATLFGGLGDDLYVIGAGISGGVGGLDSGGNDTALLLGNASIEALEGVENIVLYNTGSTALELKGRGAVDAVYAAANRGLNFTGSLGTAISATGNELANTITGNDQHNTLAGLAGNDTINGGNGNDTIDGGAGTDSMVGGAGNDTFVVDGADVVVEAVGGGFDIISSATLTSYAAYANTEGLQYTGSGAVALNNGATNTSNDFFGGGSGNDTLSGFGGNDTLVGGAGNDSIVGDAGADSLSGGDGNDTVDGGTENDTIAGGAGVDSLLGGDGNDILYADSPFSVTDTSANTLRGGNGNDNLAGALGNDALFGDAGNDTINGNDGADALDGGADNDNLVGGDGNDILSAGTQTNSGFYFSASGDVLWGNDQFGTGGTDADQFRIGAPTASNHAVETSAGSGLFYFNTGALIGDFVTGSDAIRFAASMVGDNDTALENVAEQAAPGTFSSTAEMVIFRTDAVGATFDNGFGGLSAFATSAATTVIGSANAAFATGAERLFVIDNGSSSAIFQFTAANADAAVTQDELSLIAIVSGNSTLVASDFGLF